MSSHGHSHDGMDCMEHRNNDWAKDFASLNKEDRQQLMNTLQTKITEMSAHGHSHGPNGIVSILCGLVFGLIGLMTGGSRQDDEDCEKEPSDYDSLLFGTGHADPKPVGWSITPMVDGVVHHYAPPAVLDNFWSFYVPLFGRFRIVKDERGLIQVGFVFAYWIYGNWSTFSTIFIPQYPENNISIIFILYYSFVSFMCLWSLIMASMSDPGRLNPLTDRPLATWKQCKTCGLMRPPLAHHCRRCGQCVRRMDHHCPWVNNCVGEENQFSFILLLLYSILLSLNTFIIVVLQLTWLNSCTLCDQESLVIKYQTHFFVSMIILSLMMASGTSVLLLDQHMAVLYEMPGLEYMKMKQERYISGKTDDDDDISWKRSFCEIYTDLSGTERSLFWIIPIRWVKHSLKEAII